MIEFLQVNGNELLQKTLEHFYISLLALLLAMIVAIPLGILLTRTKKLAKVVLSIASVLQTVPSLAVLALMIPFLGVGKLPAILALFIYILLPILNNTYIGINNVDKNVKAAGLSMGMTKFQEMFMIELPLAISVIMSGVRLSSVYAISWATLASFIGAGGLGDFIFNGLNLYQPDLIIGGAISVTLIALIMDFVLSKVELWVTPKGLKVSR
ncbi:ABC transporter permease [Mammaliicoccus sciuri]|mgnify:FL=1|uniref:ABC transporter permease n=2 Tax=Mammaliicoccus sciuri TaxID=1296 RepID=A0A657XJD6_MAMSC|nr:MULTISPECIES: ABC transporter permease [Mammaliicoccus]MBN4911101.1 ABC transporter permease [Staphylococcus sp. EG-SA-13]MCS5428438.1 ABC transporter permease [Staphylococcus aureus]OOV38046.1 choline ABC transporter permease [Staphylococcus sp. MB371]PCQ21680.1 ABC transporter permease [Klebsiella pneumoniae]ARB40438.1 choline ABC transporter permease [Mammaliicoccus sciuri]